MATTGAPTFSERDEPSGSGRSVRPAGSIRRRAMSESGSTPTIVASTWLPSANWTKTSFARFRSSPWPVVTTCAFVAISPSPSRTNPEPAPSCSGPRSSTPPPPNTLNTVTTPGASRSYTRCGSNGRSARVVVGEDLDARRDLDGPGALGLVVTTQRAPAEHRARGDERARGTGAPHTGSLSANVVPADVVCTSRWPVMRSASSRAIVSPRPEPCASSDV